MSGSTFTHTVVTAVKFSQDLIYAGIGSFLNIYARDSGNFIQRMGCLEGQRIYGIVHSTDGSIIVFGGKQFIILDEILSNEATMPSGCLQMCTDWLLSAVWLGPGSSTIALLTARNVVQIWESEGPSKTWEYPGRDNSILYSGQLVNLDDDMLVLAGTVFSEVIIRLYMEEEALLRLKGHKGVIYSINCDLDREIIVTTSDDRSVRIWGRNNELPSSSSTTDYWRKVEMVCKHELYGHSARVMRSCVTKDYVISVGEDSRICFWNDRGALHHKLTSHQNGSIWSVYGERDCLITGGGDGAVNVHPIGMSANIRTKVLNLKMGKPKQIAISASQNLFVLTEENVFIHYNFANRTLTTHNLGKTHTYYQMTTSPCRKKCTVTGYKTLHIFVEFSSGESTTILPDVLEGENTIFATHWAGSEYIIVSTERGALNVLKNDDTSVANDTIFTLPPCKDRWLTCADVDSAGYLFVIGDRCGGIHLFRRGTKDPIKTLHKLHGRYGPNSLVIKGNVVITTGRDKTIKYFHLRESNIKLTSTKELDFHWVEKFLDKKENMVCGFKEKMFVVFNLRKNSRIMELDCGGGHRSWDAVRYTDQVGDRVEEFIQFVYLKHSNIHIAKYQVSNILAKNLILGSHYGEINCLQSYPINTHTRLIMSGGEDTTVRVSFLTQGTHLECHAICKQLSSVRALKTYSKNKNNYLLFSAGGRAQLCIRAVKIKRVNGEYVVKTEDLIDFMLKGTDKERRGCYNWRDPVIDFNPETRIMDLAYVETVNVFSIFAGCSDAIVRVFIYQQETKMFKMIHESKHHTTCILKTICLSFIDCDMLITCSTRGEVALWNSNDVCSDRFAPFFTMQANKSGINSFAFKVYDDKLLVVTGGDDNAIQLNVIDATEHLEIRSLFMSHSLVLDKYHSSAITGLCIYGEYMFSASIDQRVTMFKFRVSDKIECNFLDQLLSNIADIHGMQVVGCDSTSLSVCVFGNGIEVLKFAVQI